MGAVKQYQLYKVAKTHKEGDHKTRNADDYEYEQVEAIGEPVEMNSVYAYRHNQSSNHTDTRFYEVGAADAVVTEKPKKTKAK